MRNVEELHNLRAGSVDLLKKQRRKRNVAKVLIKKLFSFFHL